MLKLMKYEFIYSMRSFLISFCVFWGACLLLPLFSEGIIPDIPLLTFMVAFGFTVLIMGISLALVISIFTHYYHSMFKRPAYLTLTLPVSSLQLITSKLIVSFVWLILGGMALLFGILLMGIEVSLLSPQLSLMEIIKQMPDFFNELWALISYDVSWVMGQLLYMGLGVYFLIISIYFSLTAAHTGVVRHHRVALSVCIWIVLEIALSYVKLLILEFPVVSLYIAQIPLSHYLLVLICDIALTFGTVFILDHCIEIE